MARSLLLLVPEFRGASYIKVSHICAQGWAESRGSQPGEREAVSQLLERECITANPLQLAAHLIQARPKGPRPTATT